jgi:hypothetical protein
VHERSTDLLGYLLTELILQVEHDHVAVPGVGDQARCGRAESGGTAGDQNRGTAELHGAPFA